MITLILLVVLTAGLMVALRREGQRLERVAIEREFWVRLQSIAPRLAEVSRQMSNLGVSATEAWASVAKFSEALKKASGQIGSQ